MTKTRTIRAALATALAVSLAGCGGAEASPGTVTDAKLDAVGLWVEVSVYWVDASASDGNPVVTVTDGGYVVDGRAVETLLPNPSVEYSGTNDADWCINVRFGDQVVSVNAAGDLVESAC